MRKEVQKIGLATIEHGHLLVVRKRGTHAFILPGGKPEGNEDDLEALSREVKEELGCLIANPHFEGAFTDTAADMPDTIVIVRLYVAELLGLPVPAAEIEELAWISLVGSSEQPLAPSLTNKILPHLHRRQDTISLGVSNCNVTSGRLRRRAST